MAGGKIVALNQVDHPHPFRVDGLAVGLDGANPPALERGVDPSKGKGVPFEDPAEQISGQQAGSPPESRPTVLRGFGAAGQGLAEVQHQFHPSPLLRFPLPGQLIAKSIPLTNERLEEPAGFLLHTIKLLAACFAPFRFEMKFLFESDPLAQHRM